jgi:hypothetical protein
MTKVGWQAGLEGFCGAASRYALSKDAVFEFSFHGIETIDLKFTIDKRPGCMCYLEQASLSASPSRPLSPFLPFVCALFFTLAALFPTAVLYFQ